MRAGDTERCIDPPKKWMDGNTPLAYVFPRRLPWEDNALGIELFVSDSKIERGKIDRTCR